jgi:hypothetical protein
MTEYEYHAQVGKSLTKGKGVPGGVRDAIVEGIPHTRCIIIMFEAGAREAVFCWSAVCTQLKLLSHIIDYSFSHASPRGANDFLERATHSHSTASVPPGISRTHR